MQRPTKNNSGTGQTTLARKQTEVQALTEAIDHLVGAVHALISQNASLIEMLAADLAPDEETQEHGLGLGHVEPS